MEHPTPTWQRRLLPAVAAALILLSLLMVIRRVDLSPRVESDFFFSIDDPRLQASERIAELFPSRPQILITASGEDVLSDDYLERLGTLGDELWQPIAGAMLILAAGFGIFGLSSFPPTQRFGLAVAGGTAAAAFMALFVLPWLATRIRALATS